MAKIDGFSVFEYIPPAPPRKPVSKTPPKLKYMGCNICTNCFNCPFEDGCHANYKGIVKQQLDLSLDI
jgi:hypothetical protein